MAVTIPSESEHLLDRAVQTLLRGELVAFPTETVYGLGADATNARALSLLFQTKGRPADHPVIVHLARADDLDMWARDIPPAAWELARRHWPGPLTLILPRQAHVLDQVTGGQDTVGLRVPGHPLALELLRRFGSGLAAPSANRFGRISPTRAEHVRADLPGVLVLDGGPCQVGLESTIVDFSRSEPRVLRPGALAFPDFERGGSTRAPGTLEQHYAPVTPAYRVPEIPAVLEPGVRALTWSRPPQSGLKLSDRPEEYGQQLYAALRELDGCHRILVEEPPDEPGWEAVADRVRRATRRSPSSNS